jgi:signal recognition particle subunit SRP54
MGMMPGVGQQLQDADIDESQFTRMEAMIQSMTPDERRNPDLLNNSRRRRIAAGSGTTPADVSQLTRGYDALAQMSQQMAGMDMGERMQAMQGLGQMDPSALMGRGKKRGKNKSASGGDRPRFKQRKKKSR